jgi:5,10-methylenetetrahydromethanopterin reductase
MSTAFALGYAFHGQDPAAAGTLAALAEDAGFSMVMTGDSPALYGDCFIGLTLLAQATRSCRVSSFVTNPLVRHPAVVASATSTLQSISGGRFVLGMSSGDSGPLNLGRPPATLSQLESYTAALRDLWEHGSATFEGRSLRFGWNGCAAPIYLAPGGPRGLRLAGRIADGVFIEMGVLPEVIAHALGELAAGAAEAGRTLDDIDIWWHLRACLADSVDEAAHEMRSALAGIANRALRGSRDHKLIPDELRPRFEELAARYSIQHHEGRGHAPNAPLVEELGLLDYLGERYGLLGTPDDWAVKLERLRPLGVRQVAIAGMMGDRTGFVERFGGEVFPRCGVRLPPAAQKARP